MSKREWNAWVDSSDGFASVLVGVELDGDEYCWGYDFGDECGNVHDSGSCETLPDAAEAVAQSLCEVGFDTTTDLVLLAFESGELA